MVRPPSTPREEQIVRLVEERATRAKLEPNAVADIACLLNFVVSEDEASFMVDYILWRTERPESSRE